MVELTNRQNGILIWLCCQNNFISVKKLASHFGVSNVAELSRHDLSFSRRVTSLPGSTYAA
jgi:DeoR/GlpR family transcriptional regulator of sugar metabolism